MLRSLRNKHLADFTRLIAGRNRFNRLKPVFSGSSGFVAPCQNFSASPTWSSPPPPGIVLDRKIITDSTIVDEQLRSLDSVVALENEQQQQQAASATTISSHQRHTSSNGAGISGDHQKTMAAESSPSSKVTARKKFTPEDNYALVKRILNGQAHRNAASINIPAFFLVNCVKCASLNKDTQAFLEMFDKWWAMLYDRLHECNGGTIIVLLSHLGHVNRLTGGELRRVLHRWHLQALETQFLITETKNLLNFDSRYCQTLRAFKNLYTPKDYFSLNGFPSKQLIGHVIRSFKERPAPSPTSIEYRSNLATIMRFASVLNAYPKIDDDVSFLTNHFRAFFDARFPIGSSRQQLKAVLAKEAERAKKSHDQVDQSDSEVAEDNVLSEVDEEEEEEDISIIDQLPPLTVDSAHFSASCNHEITKSSDQKNDDASLLLVLRMDQSEFSQLVITYSRFAQSFVSWRIDPNHVTPGIWPAWFYGVECLLLVHKIRDYADWPTATANAINPKFASVVKLIVACMDVTANFDRSAEFFKFLGLCVDRLQKVAPHISDRNGARVFEAVRLCESALKGRAATVSAANVSDSAVEKSAITFESTDHFIKNTSLLSIISTKAEHYYASIGGADNGISTFGKPALSRRINDQSKTIAGSIGQSESSTVSTTAPPDLTGQSEASTMTNHQKIINTKTKGVKSGGQEFFDSAAIPDNEQTWSVSDLAKQAKLYD